MVDNKISNNVCAKCHVDKNDKYDHTRQCEECEDDHIVDKPTVEQLKMAREVCEYLAKRVEEKESYAKTFIAAAHYMAEEMPLTPDDIV